MTDKKLKIKDVITDKKKITKNIVARKAYEINNEIRDLVANSEDVAKLNDLRAKLKVCGDDLKSRARKQNERLEFPNLNIIIKRTDDENVMFDVNTFKFEHKKLHDKYLIPKPVVYSFCIK